MEKYWKSFIVSFVIFGIILLGLYSYYKNNVNIEDSKTQEQINPGKNGFKTIKEKKEFLNSFNQNLSPEEKKERKEKQMKILNSYSKTKNSKNDQLSKKEKEIKKLKKQQFLNSFSKK